jgi:hypothetical protein
MDWDFHTYSLLPDCLEPIMCLAFLGLFLGSAALWLKYMEWSLSLGGKKKDAEE